MPRVTVEVDKGLLRRVMARHGIESEAAAVDFALRRLLPSDPMTREEALSMEGSGWHGDLHAFRRGPTIDRPV